MMQCENIKEYELEGQVGYMEFWLENKKEDTTL
jgi:hypothetical protein